MNDSTYSITRKCIKQTLINSINNSLNPKTFPFYVVKLIGQWSLKVKRNIIKYGKCWVKGTLLNYTNTNKMFPKHFSDLGKKIIHQNEIHVLDQKLFT